VERQKLDLIAGFVGAAAALLIFGWLADQVFHHATIQFDAAVRDGVHSFASPRLTYFFRIVTEFGSEVFLVPFGAFVVWRLAAAGRRRAAILFAVAAAGAEALDYILKLVFHRTRPVVFFGLTAPHSYSFPSGHSMLSACFFGVLAAIVGVRMSSWTQRAALWLLAASATLLIGLSRIYLGVHYPSDVLAGYAAAVIWVVSVRAGYTVWLRRSAALGGPSTAAPDTPDRARTPLETPRFPRDPDTRS
jgi:undecaprenyl-diphosphatase